MVIFSIVDIKGEQNGAPHHPCLHGHAVELVAGGGGAGDAGGASRGSVRTGLEPMIPQMRKDKKMVVMVLQYKLPPEIAASQISICAAGYLVAPTAAEPPYISVNTFRLKGLRNGNMAPEAPQHLTPLTQCAYFYDRKNIVSLFH